MKKQLLIITLMLLSTVIFAQKIEKETKIKSNHAVGVAGGPTIGCGLAYQYTYSKYSAQITFLPYKNTNKEMYCIGLSFYYTLNQGRKTRLFLYQGNHYYYSKSEWESWNNEKESFIENDIDNYFNNSLGIGFDLTILDNVSLNIMAGYAGYENFTQLNLTGEISLLYHIPSKNK